MEPCEVKGVTPSANKTCRFFPSSSKLTEITCNKLYVLLSDMRLYLWYEPSFTGSRVFQCIRYFVLIQYTQYPQACFDTLVPQSDTSSFLLCQILLWNTPRVLSVPYNLCPVSCHRKAGANWCKHDRKYTLPFDLSDDSVLDLSAGKILLQAILYVKNSSRISKLLYCL